MMIKRGEVNEIHDRHLAEQKARILELLFPHLEAIMSGEMTSVPADVKQKIMWDLAARDCVLTIKEEVATLNDFPIA